MKNYLLFTFCTLFPILGNAWEMGSFERSDSNPILSPRKESTFFCPIEGKEIHWESDHVFNPAAVVRDGKVYLLYRAEDDYGDGIGFHISRLGLAISEDGVHFQRSQTPVFYPDLDDQSPYEFPGGCEDPRIVETEEGSYVMLYTQWNRAVAVLGVATSSDLIHWKKHGYAFQHSCPRFWCKSGSIICKKVGDKLIAAKIHGKYWMYWGEGEINIALSDDLISWRPYCDVHGKFVSVLQTRKDKFDSHLVECGPPAILTSKGILLLYNGKSESGAYSAGQALFSLSNPSKLIARSEECFLKPEKPYEKNGQYTSGTVFIEGLVFFNGRWFLYYGTADSSIGVAIAN